MIKHIKIISAILIIILLLSPFPLTAENAYDGTAGSWAIPEIKEAEKNQLTYEAILSDFKKPITREEFCVISLKLYEKLTGEIIKPVESPFTDTNNPEIIKANMLGIVLGTGGGKFSPEKSITRQELSVMIYRALDKALPEMSKTLKNKLKITDEKEIAAWAKEAAAYSFDREIVKGIGEGVFDPLSNTTREQSIAIINRTYESHKDVEVAKDSTKKEKEPTEVENDKTGETEKDKIGDGEEKEPIETENDKTEGTGRIDIGMFKPDFTDIKDNIKAVDKIQLSRKIMKPEMHNPISKMKIIDKVTMIELVDGNLFPLLDTEYIDAMSDIDLSKISATPQLVQDLINVPSSISGVKDLRKYQTSIKSQLGRGTCSTFAFCAALEAAYKRLDPVKYENIDLSEQYLHHIQNTANLMHLMGYWQDSSGSKFSYERENKLGRWGGAYVENLMAMLSKNYGVCEEKYMPYIGGHEYEIYDFGIKDFNKADNEESKSALRINSLNFRETELRREALLNANYGIKEWAAIPKDKLTDLTQYEAVLDAGYEIILSFEMVGKDIDGDPSPGDNIWDPEIDPMKSVPDPERRGHALILVGYDRNNKAFIAKNSWGYDNKEEDGFTLFSYKWITHHRVKSAMYITKVVENPEVNRREKQKYLRRWIMVFDGQSYLLTVNRIPGTLYEDFYKPLGEKNAVFDRRMGLFSDGTKNGTYKVNGQVLDHKIFFNIDFDNGNFPYDSQKGSQFSAFMFADNPQTMTGHGSIGGTEHFFYCYDSCLKKDPFDVQSADKGKVTLSDFTKEWTINRNGNSGTFKIIAIYGTDQDYKKEIVGRYVEKGVAVDVKGKILLVYNNKNEYEKNYLLLTIPLSDGSVGEFQGNILPQNKNILCGTYTTSKTQYTEFPWIGHGSK